MYHQLVDEPTADPYDVTRACFEEHMETLAGHGFVGTSIARGLHQYAAGRRTVILTFDDGNASDASSAAEILRRFGFTATFFVTSGHVGTSPRWLDWGMARALRDGGMEIGAHGHTHRFLVNLPEHKLHEELEMSRRLIGERVGIEPDAMSCPGGRFDQATLAAARAVGFRKICTSEPCTTSRRALEAGTVPRFQVRQDFSPSVVLGIARGEATTVSPMHRRYRNRERLRRLLGHRFYQALWEWRYGKIEA